MGQQGSPKESQGSILKLGRCLEGTNARTSKSAEALCLRACRTALNPRSPNPPVPGEGISPPLPLPTAPARWAVGGSELVGTPLGAFLVPKMPSKSLFFSHLVFQLIFDRF